MSRVPDKDVEHTERPTVDTAPAGRVEIDSRGHNVWRWARDVLESTSVLLKRLDNKDLALEPTQKVPVMRGAELAQKNQKTPTQQAAKPAAKAATKPSASASPEAAKPAARHPALQRERDPRNGGGGFDPYNSR